MFLELTCKQEIHFQELNISKVFFTFLLNLIKETDIHCLPMCRPQNDSYVLEGEPANIESAEFCTFLLVNRWAIPSIASKAVFLCYQVPIKTYLRWHLWDTSSCWHSPRQHLQLKELSLVFPLCGSSPRYGLHLRFLTCDSKVGLEVCLYGKETFEWIVTVDFIRSDSEEDELAKMWAENKVTNNLMGPNLTTV